MQATVLSTDGTASLSLQTRNIEFAGLRHFGIGAASVGKVKGKTLEHLGSAPSSGNCLFSYKLHSMSHAF
jgi:hypothetical protein